MKSGPTTIALRALKRAGIPLSEALEDELLASMQPNPSHGGARQGSGVKAADGVTKTVSRSISIDAESEDTLRGLADGNLSLGVREAARIVKESHRECE